MTVSDMVCVRRWRVRTVCVVNSGWVSRRVCMSVCAPYKTSLSRAGGRVCVLRERETSKENRVFFREMVGGGEGGGCVLARSSEPPR